MHAIGGGDLGIPGAVHFSIAVPDYEGASDAVGKERRPLRKVFDGLAKAEIPPAGVVLLGTTTPSVPGGPTLARCAAEIRERLVSDSGLCGARFDASAVAVVEIDDRGLRATNRALAPWLLARRPEELLVTTGSGALSLSMGAVCAGLEAGIPVRILHIDRASLPYSLDGPRDMEAHLDAWLVRHRFWDALRELDEEKAEVWRLLAERQAGGVAVPKERAVRLAALGVDEGKVGKLRERTETMRAALFERLGRGEAADYGLLRAWYVETLDGLRKRENLSPETQTVVSRLVAELRNRAGGVGNLSGRLQIAMHDLKCDITSACAAMVKDEKLTDLYRHAASHRAHLTPELQVPGHLPPTLVSAADRWEKGDQGVNLIKRLGRTPWPALGSGDVLGLLAVGMGRPGREVDDLRAAKAVLGQLALRRDRLLRQGVVRLRLLASPEVGRRAHDLAREIAGGGADIKVIDGVEGDLYAVRDHVVEALSSEAAPTGRTGSGSLRDVDELVLVLNPGPPMTNYGMVAAGVDWSLRAACPLWLTELGRDSEGHPELWHGDPVLARLGLDSVLARLAAGAVRRLDLRTAQRLVERGSDALRELLPDLRRFEADVFARDEWGIGREKVARRRLMLIDEVCADLPVPSAYLAVESLRPGLFPWQKWREKRAESPALDELAVLANKSLHGHAMDRRPDGKYRPLDVDKIRALLHQAVCELGGPRPDDDELITRYKSLMLVFGEKLPE
ncbi:hypothetical protein [Sinosporangium album]|uniref:hypothetical protein n=1 Tax=Sinosporangium album TaxID=504805 RepID=UPI00115FCAE4|nr:hypothetical protein [Sinosporangium album]